MADVEGSSHGPFGVRRALRSSFSPWFYGVAQYTCTACLLCQSLDSHQRFRLTPSCLERQVLTEIDVLWQRCGFFLRCIGVTLILLILCLSSVGRSGHLRDGVCQVRLTQPRHPSKSKLVMAMIGKNFSCGRPQLHVTSGRFQNTCVTTVCLLRILLRQQVKSILTFLRQHAHSPCHPKFWGSHSIPFSKF